MDDENTGIPGESITIEKTSVSQETPFDRLEARIDALIERYERLRSEHSGCSQQLAEKEARIRQLESDLEHFKQQRSEIGGRLDALIDKLSRFS